MLGLSIILRKITVVFILFMLSQPAIAVTTEYYYTLTNDAHHTSSGFDLNTGEPYVETKQLLGTLKVTIDDSNYTATLDYSNVFESGDLVNPFRSNEALNTDIAGINSSSLVFGVNGTPDLSSYGNATLSPFSTCPECGFEMTLNLNGASPVLSYEGHYSPPEGALDAFSDSVEIFATLGTSNELWQESIPGDNTAVTSIFTEDGTETSPGDSITITNLSTSTQQISSVIIKLENASGNVVFNPNDPSPSIPFVLSNTTGDTGFTGTPTFSDDYTALILVPVVDIRTAYKTLTLHFNAFDPGEEVLITLDLDKNGGLDEGDGANESVSGSDFANAEIFITFTDGESLTYYKSTYSSLNATSAQTSIATAFASIPVPIPMLTWLLGSIGLLAVAWIARKKSYKN